METLKENKSNLKVECCVNLTWLVVCEQPYEGYRADPTPWAVLCNSWW